MLVIETGHLFKCVDWKNKSIGVLKRNYASALLKIIGEILNLKK